MTSSDGFNKCRAIAMLGLPETAWKPAVQSIWSGTLPFPVARKPLKEGRAMPGRLGIAAIGAAETCGKIGLLTESIAPDPAIISSNHLLFGLLGSKLRLGKAAHSILIGSLILFCGLSSIWRGPRTRIATAISIFSYIDLQKPTCAQLASTIQQSY
jgi:hypothetical protein